MTYVTDKSKCSLTGRVERLEENPRKFRGDFHIAAQNYHDGRLWQPASIRWVASPLGADWMRNEAQFFEVHVNLKTLEKRIYPRKNLPEDGKGAFACRSTGYLRIIPIGKWTDVLRKAALTHQTDTKLQFGKLASYFLTPSGYKFYATVDRDFPLAQLGLSPEMTYGVEEHGIEFDVKRFARNPYWNPVQMAAAGDSAMRFAQVAYRNGELRLGFDPTGLGDFVLDDTGVWQVGASADDGYRYSASSYITTANGDGTGAYNGYDNEANWRFTGVTVPNGATVTVFHPIFYAHASSTTVLNASLHIEDADNPGPVTDYTDFMSRSRTTGVVWNPPSWTINNWYDTSVDGVNLASDATGVFARVGWASGQAVQIFSRNLSGVESNVSRTAKSFNSSPTNCTKLYIEWTAGGAGWSHSFLGVANASIGSINGVAKANIGSVNGVV